MPRFDLLDEFTTVCVPVHHAPRHERRQPIKHRPLTSGETALRGTLIYSAILIACAVSIGI